MAGTIETLRKEAGIVVERYNLASAPSAFASNPVVADYLNAHGIGSLPLVLVDGAILIAGRYPTNCEFSSVFGFPRSRRWRACSSRSPSC